MIHQRDVSLPNDPIFAIRLTLIAVFGGRDCSAADYENAGRLGQLIAEHGFGLICGGRNGVMEAACRGAAQAGGQTIGILPDDSDEAANPWVQIAIPSGIGIARNSIIVRACRAAVAIGGKYGTLSEIAYALDLHIPIFGIGTWEIPGVRAVSTPEAAMAGIIEELDWKSGQR